MRSRIHLHRSGQPPPDPTDPDPVSAGESGFSRTDLALVVAVLAVLALVASPALSRPHVASDAIVCLNNKRQLIQAWLQFAEANHDVLPGAYHGGLALAPIRNDPNSPWCVGWEDWTTSTQNTNTLFLTDSQYNSLAQFLDHQAAPFQCPADVYLSPAQQQKGWSTRVRSVSGNIANGPGNVDAGPWDITWYVHVTKLSGFTRPAPAEVMQFLDEHPDSINDPAFFGPTSTHGIDLPASYHDGATSFAFVDGRAEMHRWAVPSPPAASVPRPVRFFAFAGWDVQTGKTDADILWLRNHAAHR